MVPHDKAGGLLLDSPGRREAACRHCRYLIHEQPQPSCEQGDISTTAAAKILSRAVNDLTESFTEIG